MGAQASCPMAPNCGGHGVVMTPSCQCVCDAGWQTGADQLALAAGGSSSAVFCFQAFSATTPGEGSCLALWGIVRVRSAL